MFQSQNDSNQTITEQSGEISSSDSDDQVLCKSRVNRIYLVIFL